MGFGTTHKLGYMVPDFEYLLELRRSVLDFLVGGIPWLTRAQLRGQEAAKLWNSKFAVAQQGSSHN